MTTPTQPRSATARHTPGPWSIHNAKIMHTEWPRFHTVVQGDSIYLAYVFSDESKFPGSLEANARLIAASPRMYDFTAKMAATGGCPEAQSIIDSLR